MTQLTESLGLSSGPTGTLVRTGDPGWEQARAPWVVNVDQQPAVVALVRSVADVSAVVASAGRCGMRVAGQGTGHGALQIGSLEDTVLLRTGALITVEVDDDTQTAWVGAGAEWGSVSAAAAEHGLAAQAGSSADVGVAGYLLSGGISWLGRSKGLAVNDVLALEVVGSDGVARVVDHDHEPEVFWALRGGGGGFGVVTAFHLRLHRLATVVAGTLFFPMTRAGEVLHVWRRWTRTVAKETMSCGRLLQLPPLPEVPEMLRGQAFVSVEVAHQGGLADLDRIIAPLRELGPVIDTIADIPASRLAELHMDPPGPTPCLGNGMLLDDAPPASIDAWVACAGHGSGSPLLSVELRHLGGAVAERPSGAGAVGHFDAEFVMYAVGIAADAATAAKTAAYVEAVGRAFSPWAAAVQYANFVEHPGGRERFHDGETFRRLRAVKERVDPTGIFTGSHPIGSR